MPKFITRVELHAANSDDYVRLHAFMEQAKFHRTIRGDDGVTYALPTAEYHSFGELSALDVRHLASNAAARTGKSYWVLVSEYSTCAWVLNPVSNNGATSLIDNLRFLLPTH